VDWIEAGCWNVGFGGAVCEPGTMRWPLPLRRSPPPVV
jgi:hypothetical protein